KKYSALINNQHEAMFTLRGLLDFAKHRNSISIDEVEPASDILKRFATGAMSFGSISHEAHSTLAIAMNRIGGISNTGEGGEDENLYKQLPYLYAMRSLTKQLSGARFGATSNYIIQTDKIHNKITQVANPEQGRQISGNKDIDLIAKSSHTTPSVGLIS